MNSESPPTKINSNTSSDEYINLEENDLVQQRCNNSQTVNEEYEWPVSYTHLRAHET